MPLPVAMLFQAMQHMAAHHASAAHHKASARRSELAAQIQMLRISAEKEKVEAQKTIILAMLEAAEGVFAAKMDAYNAGFQALSSHINERRIAFEEEAKELRRLRRESQNVDDRVAARARIGDIDEELASLDDFMLKATKEHNQIVYGTQLEFNQPSGPVLQISGSK